MSVYREQLRDVLRAVSIPAPGRYAWLGRRSREPGGSSPRAYLVHGLSQELYVSFYCRGRVEPARWGRPEPTGSDPRLALAVARANAGRGGLEGGWTVARVEGEEVALARGGVRVRAALASCRGEVVPGGAVSLTVPPEPSPLSPGFLTLLADAGDVDSADLVRVYWHVTDRGAPELVRALTTHLGAEGVPFRLKVADHALRYDRCDAAVLYVGLDAFDALRPFLIATAERLAHRLRPRIPAFTLALAPGAGLAEEAGASGASFGERRCEQLAEGLADAPAGDEEARLAAVVARFERDGVAIDAPYLEPELAGRHVL
jgi:hypothetical protein